MSGPVITKPKLIDAIADAAAPAIKEAAESGAATLAYTKARKAAEEAVADPRIAASLEPISRVRSQVYQGASVPVFASAAVIIAKWAGYELDVQDVIVVFTAAAIAGGAWVAYGRETTTRPLG
jgi:hypothetical protein